MSKTELKNLVMETLKDCGIPEAASIALTWHGDKCGYCVCVRTPHFSHFTQRNEYSLPVTCMVHLMQGKERVKAVIQEYTDYYSHLAVA